MAVFRPPLETCDAGATRGIGNDTKSKRLAYVALTRIRVGGPGRPAYASVINNDLRIAGFDSVFRQWAIPAIPTWAPPSPEDRVS